MKKINLIFIPFLFSYPLMSFGQGYLENPVSGSTESGISSIRGWRCNVKKVTAVIDDAAVGSTPVGETRPGTESYCGTTDSGYSLLVNFNGFSVGPHNLKVYGDGELIGEVNFNTVRSGGVDYLTNTSKVTTVPNFPSAGKTATLTWSESKQNFVVTSISGGDAPANASAEGFWIGKTANNTAVQLAILENGETWGLYGTSTGLTGAVYGSTSTNGTSLSGSGLGFNFLTRTSGSGTFNGNVTTEGSISFNVSDGTKLTAAYDSSYEQPASLANLAGTYKGQAVTGTIAPQATTVIVDINGNISSSFISGNLSCTTTGKATQRASGKNVFNVQVTFAGNFCALGNGTVVNGVATYIATSRQLITMALNGAKTDGLIFIGKR